MDMLNAIWRDLVHACRSLAKARAFTCVCVVTLGIGMAPIIGIQYGSRILTTPPPGVNADGLIELVTVRVGPHGATDRWSYSDFMDLRHAVPGALLTGWAVGDMEASLPASGSKRKWPTMFVSSNYFRTIGVELARGPGFLTDTPDPVVVLGYSFWQRQLAADPDIVGKTLTLNSVPHVVAGIAHVGFEGHQPFQEAAFFVPIQLYPRLLADNRARFDRSTAWVHIHGRLSPGVSVAQASANVAAVTSHLAQEHPATNEFTAGIAAPYHPIGTIEGSNVSIVIAVWQAMTALPLLVVCLNISGMLQVRTAMRERELTIRRAIGASRRRMIQHLLAEAVVLAALGGLLASLLLFNLPPVVSWWLGEPMPAQMEQALSIDVSMVATTIGLCLATSLVFGWLPALRFSRRPALMSVLKDEAGSGGVRAGRAHRVTTALQIAIAVPLLILSFIALDRMGATATADLGFASDMLYAAPLGLDTAAGTNADLRIRKVRESLTLASGVASVSIADGLPLDYRYRIARVSTEADADAAPRVDLAQVTRVGEGYADTMGIALVRGRDFTRDDVAGAPRVTIISKALAERLFPQADPIGEQITFGLQGKHNQKSEPLTVVGVTSDFPTSQMTTDRAQMLVPFAQHPDVRRDSVPVADDRQGTPKMMVVVRSAIGEPPAKLTAAIENTVRDIDPAFNRSAIVTGAQLRQNSMSDFFDQFGISGVSGSVTLVLAGLGIYGVVGLMVATRTREIAVRIALGASRLRVLGMIVADVVKLAAPGVVVGVLIAVVVAYFEGGLIADTIEPFAYVAGAAIATLAAVLASLPPARRAASVEPMVVMRPT